MGININSNLFASRLAQSLAVKSGDVELQKRAERVAGSMVAAVVKPVEDAVAVACGMDAIAGQCLDIAATIAADPAAFLTGVVTLTEQEEQEALEQEALDA